MLMAQPQPVPAAMDYAAAGDRATSGLLCSTSGTVLHDRDQLRDHYSSGASGASSFITRMLGTVLPLLLAGYVVATCQESASSWHGYHSKT
jgi:hypothetical protein